MRPAPNVCFGVNGYAINHRSGDQAFQCPAQVLGDMRYMVLHKQTQSSSVIMSRPGLSLASRLMRWISVPTAHWLPAGELVMRLRMNSVEPTSSPAGTRPTDTRGGRSLESRDVSSSPARRARAESADERNNVRATGLLVPVGPALPLDRRVPREGSRRPCLPAEYPCGKPCSGPGARPE